MAQGGTVQGSNQRAVDIARVWILLDSLHRRIRTRVRSYVISKTLLLYCVTCQLFQNKSLWWYPYLVISLLGHEPEGWRVSSRVANSDYYFWVPICICCSLSLGSNLRQVAFILLPQIFYFHISLEISLRIFICKACAILSNLVTGYTLSYKCPIQCSEITIKWKLKKHYKRMHENLQFLWKNRLAFCINDIRLCPVSSLTIDIKAQFLYQCNQTLVLMIRECI